MTEGCCGKCWCLKVFSRVKLDNDPASKKGFFQAFEGLDPNVIATWGEAKVKKLLLDKRIIRHRGKIKATLANARVWQKLEAGVGFSTSFGLPWMDGLFRITGIIKVMYPPRQLFH